MPGKLRNFGKLLKNEIKMSAHSMMNIYLAAAVTIGIMLLAYVIDIGWLSALATIALFLIALIALVITFVGVIANFQKTLYGNQGYLSFTLPVTSGELLAAKAIVAFLWMILSYAVSIGIMIWIYDYITSMIGENNIQLIKTLISMFREMPGSSAIKGYLVLLVLSVFIQLVFLISELFFSLTFANTRVMQKLGAAGPIIVFFAIFIVTQILNFVFTNYVPIIVSPGTDGLVFSVGKQMSAGNLSFGITGVIFELLASVGLFFGTGWLMNHKVNIK